MTFFRMRMAYNGLIVGLGNPGRKYEGTRHNFGFAVLETLLDRGKELGEMSRIEKSRRFSLHAWRPDEDGKWLLTRPYSYMNRSGEPLAHLIRKFGIPPQCLLVVHDDLDLPFGRLRLKFDSGLAGHNGLRSIADKLGTKAFYRLRMGVGRAGPRRGSGANYVLSSFSSEEKRILPDILDEAERGIRLFCNRGPETAMNRIHSLDRSFSETDTP
ncbi:MAG: aminoacyl-tRNA hydrolase [Desulfohalobiaceae bacterium]